jgi:hypothetical protein
MVFVVTGSRQNMQMVDEEVAVSVVISVPFQDHLAGG